MDNNIFNIHNIDVYIKTDSNNYVTEVNSSIFIRDTTDWIKIDEGVGDRYAHAQGNYFDKPITNTDGTHNYKLVDSKVVEATEEERTAELASFTTDKPVTDKERIEQLEQELDDTRMAIAEMADLITGGKE